MELVVGWSVEGTASENSELLGLLPTTTIPWVEGYVTAF